MAHRIWSRKGIASQCLTPLSWIGLAWIRYKQAQYRRHPERVFRTSVPVVIVGNIYVGGTGKTPVVMALVNALQKSGWKPGVISRGYGATPALDAMTGRGTLDARYFGDEPALIASATGAPVAVHPRRALAVDALLRDFPEVDVVVADDGLQHLALGRDLEILVQDARGVGNGRVLPAGPLREPADRLQHVDFVVNNLTDVSHPSSDQPVRSHAIKHGPCVPRLPMAISMRLRPQRAVHLMSGKTEYWHDWLTRYQGERISAVAAIGQPQRFFDMLRNEGLDLASTWALPDHDPYTTSPFGAIDSTIILVTPKDAVKCTAVQDTRLWSVEADPDFLPKDWLQAVHKKLGAIALQKRGMAARPR